MTLPELIARLTEIHQMIHGFLPVALEVEGEVRPFNGKIDINRRRDGASIVLHTTSEREEEEPIVIREVDPRRPAVDWEKTCECLRAVVRQSKTRIKHLQAAVRHGIEACCMNPTCLEDDGCPLREALGAPRGVDPDLDEVCPLP